MDRAPRGTTAEDKRFRSLARIAAAATITALILGIGLTIWQWHRANQLATSGIVTTGTVLATYPPECTYYGTGTGTSEICGNATVKLAYAAGALPVQATVPVKNAIYRVGQHVLLRYQRSDPAHAVIPANVEIPDSGVSALGTGLTISGVFGVPLTILLWLASRGRRKESGTGISQPTAS